MMFTALIPFILGLICGIILTAVAASTHNNDPWDGI